MAISVPAARLTGIRGTLKELSPTPLSSSGSANSEAVVRVRGHTKVTLLSGITADVRLGSGG